MEIFFCKIVNYWESNQFNRSINNNDLYCSFRNELKISSFKFRFGFNSFPLQSGVLSFTLICSLYLHCCDDDDETEQKPLSSLRLRLCSLFPISFFHFNADFNFPSHCFNLISLRSQFFSFISFLFLFLQRRRKIVNNYLGRSRRFPEWRRSHNLDLIYSRQTNKSWTMISRKHATTTTTTANKIINNLTYEKRKNAFALPDTFKWENTLSQIYSFSNLVS